jgi:hypothetical protein
MVSEMASVHEACVIPPCALATLREETNTGQQLEALQDLWLDGKLIGEDTPPWRIRTPARGLLFSALFYCFVASERGFLPLVDDVLEMIDKMIKSVSGDFSEDIGVTSVGRSALPEIHHWGRLAALVRKSVGKVVAPPVNAAVRAVRCVGYLTVLTLGSLGRF